MKRFRLLPVLAGAILIVPEARACPWCRPEVEAAVYNPDFIATALLLLLPLAVIALVGVALHFADGRAPSHARVDPHGNDL
jgi:hypothetical protein